MDNFVLDTSVIVKWFNQQDEQNVDKAHLIINDLALGKIAVTIPDLLIVELHNALKKGKKLLPADINKSFEVLFSLPLTIEEPTIALMKLSAEIAEQHDLTAYDSIFIATALKHECLLISDDVRGHGELNNRTVLMLADYPA